MVLNQIIVFLVKKIWHFFQKHVFPPAHLIISMRIGFVKNAILLVKLA
jgi:hypothetical protein